MMISRLISIDRLEEKQGQKGGLLGLDTGYPRLNQITSGLQESDLIVIPITPPCMETDSRQGNEHDP